MGLLFTYSQDVESESMFPSTTTILDQVQEYMLLWRNNRPPKESAIAIPVWQVNQLLDSILYLTKALTCLDINLSTVAWGMQDWRDECGFYTLTATYMLGDRQHVVQTSTSS